MANPISSLLVRIGADTSGLEAGGRRASSSMDDLGRKSVELGKKMAVLGAAAAAAGAALATKLVKSGLDAIDAQAKLARSLDASIDGLRGLQLAASEAGVKNEQLTSALRNLNARLGEAMRGTGEGKVALDALGLSARALSQLDTDQRMAVIADRMRELGLSSSQAADLLRKLGFENENFVPLMLAGGDAIRQARQDIDAFGLSLSAVDAAKIEQANDAMGRIGLTFEAIRNQITIAFAPLLKELADRFNLVARENQGFANIARSTAESIIRSFGKVADVVHVLRTTFKGLELVVANLKAVQISVAEAIIRLWSGVGDAITAVINAGIRGLNALGANIDLIPSPSDSAFVRGLKEMGATARAEVGQVRMELVDLASAEWPSKGVEQFLEDVRKRAQEAAEAMSSVTTGGGGDVFGGGVGSEGEEDPQAVELERYREMLARKLEALQEQQLTEAELELKRHEERLLALSEALALEMVTAEEARALQESLEEEHMRRMGEIRKKGWTDIQKFQNSTLSQQVAQVSGYLANITAGVARENKAMFEINKVAGIANAIVAAHEGISLTMSKYPYPINIGMAAAHAAAAFAQVNAIKNSSFSSGGSAPSLAGGTPATPVTPVTGGTPQTAERSVLTVEGIDPGSLFSGRAVRELAERLQEHMRDGGTVQFA